MKTDLEYEAPPALEPIPRCKRLIRKGEAPRLDGKNIFTWTHQLALQPHKFEEFKGPRPVDMPKVFERTAPAVKPDPLANVNTNEPSADDLFQVQIFTAFDNLQPNEISLKGFPMIERVRELTGIEDLPAEKMRASWAEYKEVNKKDEKE